MRPEYSYGGDSPSSALLVTTQPPNQPWSASSWSVICFVTLPCALHPPNCPGPLAVNVIV